MDAPICNLRTVQSVQMPEGVRRKWKEAIIAKPRAVTLSAIACVIYVNTSANTYLKMLDPWVVTSAGSDFCDRKDLNRHVNRQHQSSLSPAPSARSTAAIKRRHLHSPHGRDPVNSHESEKQTAVPMNPQSRNPTRHDVSLASRSSGMVNYWRSRLQELEARSVPTEYSNVGDKVSAKQIRIPWENFSERPEYRIAGQVLDRLEKQFFEHNDRTLLQSSQHSVAAGEMVAIYGPIVLIAPKQLAITFSSDFNPESHFKMRCLRVPKQKLKMRSQVQQQIRALESGVMKAIFLLPHLRKSHCCECRRAA